MYRQKEYSIRYVDIWLSWNIHVKSWEWQVKDFVDMYFIHDKI